MQIYYDSLVNIWMYNAKPDEKIKFPLRTPWKHVVEMIYTSAYS
jgi:hypothetical protein